MKKNNAEIIENRRMIEYQKAQDSAEHYNNMIWTLMSLGVVGSLIILHLFWTTEFEILYSLIMLFIGSFVLFYFSYLIETADEKKKWKYLICQKIEQEYNFIGQNSGIDKLTISKNRKGMNIFRIIKFLLFTMYGLSIIVGFVNAIDNGKNSTLLLVSFILILFEIIGAFGLEIYYGVKSK